MHYEDESSTPLVQQLSRLRVDVLELRTVFSLIEPPGVLLFRRVWRPATIGGEG